MGDGQLNLDELAAQAGLSRRAIRFYVQRRLLPPPLGLGRGRHYDQRHVEVLKRIAELQAAGHSLDGISKILGGADAAEVEKPGLPAGAGVAPGGRRAALSAALWTRLKLAPGVELHFDASAHPSAEQLINIRQAVRRILRPELLKDDQDQETDDAEED
jgi:DNA-binding transcriptional MerR regulator